MAIETAKIIISAEDKTKQAFQSIKGSLGTISGLVGGIGVGAFALAVKQAADFNDEMGKAAQKVGVTTRELSALKYAGDLSGVSFEGLQNGLRRLSTTLFDAAEGSKLASDSFSAIGINIKDSSGNLKNADVVLKELADRFQTIPDGANKTALAVRLLGKSGADLIPLLNQGSSGLRDMAKEAEAFGQIVDQEAAAAAERFNDNIERISKAFSGFKIQAANDVIPALEQIAEKMAAAAREGGLLKSAMLGLGETGKIALFGSDEELRRQRSDFGIPSEITRLQSKLTADAKGIAPLENTERFKIQQEIQFLAREKNNLDRMLGRVKDEEKPTRPLPDGGLGETLTKPKSSGVDKDVQAAQRFIDKLKEQSDTLGMSREELLRYEASQLRLTDAQRANVAAMIEQIGAQERLTKEREAWAQIEESQRRQSDEELRELEELSAAEIQRTEALEQQALAIKELFDPSLKLMNIQQEYDQLLDAGLITMEEYSFAMKKAADDISGLSDTGKSDFDELKRAIEGFGDSAAETFVDLAFTGKASFGDMVDSILRDLAKLAIKRGITDDLFGMADGFLGDLFGGFSFGGARASGGPVGAGKTYLVGERGPELFTPSTSGTIIPNDFNGGGNVSVNVNVDAAGGDVSSNADFGKRLGTAIKQVVQQELMNERRHGGALA